MSDDIASGRRSVSILLLVASAIVPSHVLARPQAFKPAFAIQRAGSAFLALSLTGSGFGAPSATSFVQVRATSIAGAAWLVVPSTDPSIVLWSDQHVVVKVPPDLSRARIAVQTEEGRSSWARATYYDFQSFDTSSALGSQAAPHHITIDGDGRVWINPEFHFGIAYFDPAANTVKPAFWPRLPVPAFRSLIGGGQTTGSDFGEDAITDSKGRVWLPEGGDGNLGPRNHGRIVGYDPPGHRVLVFNLPGDRNNVFGVAWDNQRNRLWFMEAGIINNRNGILVSFDPDSPAIPREEYPWDFASLPTCSGGVCSDGRSCSTFRDCMIGTFDFTTAATCAGGVCSNATYHSCETVDDCVLADKLCPPGVQDDSGCYHEYHLPDYQPAHIVVHPRDGSVWWANYFLGANLGRLDPLTGEITRYPLAPPPFSPTELTVDSFGAFAAVLYRLADWLWDVDVAPNGDILATEYYSNRIARFQFSQMSNPACGGLIAPPGSSVSCVASPLGNTYPQTIQLPDPSCINPCITESLLPDSWVVDASTPPFTHAPATSLLVISQDRRRNVWFGQGVFVKGEKNFALFPPLLALYPSTYGPPASLHAGLGAGMVVNSATGEIWATDYSGLRLNRLLPLR
jgi:streptogramin lyase